mmetsp:Transcript_84341/g.243837  ORF Transcript_84341/g.243837 Transcript_84341/m.243837 type:complete len:234 (+) Transcript_84341:1792-2493(+)
MNAHLTVSEALNPADKRAILRSTVSSRTTSRILEACSASSVVWMCSAMRASRVVATTWSSCCNLALQPSVNEFACIKRRSNSAAVSWALAEVLSRNSLSSSRSNSLVRDSSTLHSMFRLAISVRRLSRTAIKSSDEATFGAFRRRDISRDDFAFSSSAASPTIMAPVAKPLAPATAPRCWKAALGGALGGAYADSDPSEAFGGVFVGGISAGRCASGGRPAAMPVLRQARQAA